MAERDEGAAAEDKDVVVIGGGLAGYKAAQDLTQLGLEVLLVDRRPHLGGSLDQHDAWFTGGDCSWCKTLPLFAGDSITERCLRRQLDHVSISPAHVDVPIGQKGWCAAGRTKAVPEGIIGIEEAPPDNSSSRHRGVDGPVRAHGQRADGLARWQRERIEQRTIGSHDLDPAWAADGDKAIGADDWAGARC